MDGTTFKGNDDDDKVKDFLKEVDWNLLWKFF